MGNFFATCCGSSKNDNSFSQLKDMDSKYENDEKYAINQKNDLIWVRNETKYQEGRVALTPQNAEKLIKAGYTIVVEKSPGRCFSDTDYERVGCKLVATDSWMTDAPRYAYILGLKELEDDKPKVFKRRHILFSHSFKGQKSAIPLLKRFVAGKGEILDLEFLVDKNGRRVAAFGVSAGKGGMVMGLLTWCNQILGETIDKITPFKDEETMIKQVKAKVDEAISKNDGVSPKIIVIGALGRCGNGAITMANACGISDDNITKWDLDETKKGGPFDEIVKEHDIFANCILLTKKIPPFITKDMCNEKNRKLTVITDVSADASNPNNPVPLYNTSTTVDNPIMTLIEKTDDNPILQVTSIDHLPSLLPTTSSIEYSDALLSTLMQLKDYDKSPVWKRAKDKYQSVLKANNLV